MPSPPEIRPPLMHRRLELHRRLEVHRWLEVRPRRQWRRVRSLAAALAGALAVALAGPIATALATFTATTAGAAPTIATVTPVAASGLGSQTCGLTVGGVLSEQITLSWSAGGAPVSGWAILVNGVVVARLPAGQTTWVDPTLLTVGAVQLSVRASFGAAGTWYADTSPLTVSFATPGSPC